MTTPSTSPDIAGVDPLAHPTCRRILLSESASRFLTESGESAFIILSKASYPATPGRWAVFLQPCPKALAKDACDLAMGTAVFRRMKASKLTTSSSSAVTSTTSAP